MQAFQVNQLSAYLWPAEMALFRQGTGKTFHLHSQDWTPRPPATDIAHALPWLALGFLGDTTWAKLGFCRISPRSWSEIQSAGTFNVWAPWGLRLGYEEPPTDGGFLLLVKKTQMNQSNWLRCGFLMVPCKGSWYSNLVLHRAVSNMETTKLQKTMRDRLCLRLVNVLQGTLEDGEDCWDCNPAKHQMHFW